MMAGGHVGHVRAVFSRRRQGFAVPVDLLRVHLRGCNRLSAERHNAAVYERLAGDFAGYLVTESDCDSISDAETFEAIDLVLADGKATTEETAQQRARAALGIDDLPVWRDRESGRVVCLGSINYVRGLRDGFDSFERDCLDAPHHLPAGSVTRHVANGEAMASDRRFFRDGWFK